MMQIHCGKIRQLALCLLLLLLFPAGAGCADTGTQVRIAYSHQGFETESWIFMYDTLQRLATENGFELIVRNAEEDPDKQLDDVQDLLAAKVDGIILAPQDGDTAVGLIAMCNREEIPVGILNRPPSNLNGHAILGATDNYQIARKTVEYLATEALRLHPGKSALILVGDLNDVNAVERRQGFLDALALHGKDIAPAIQVATEWNAATAASNLEAALDENPEIGMIFASSDFLYPEIERILSERGLWQKRGDPVHVVLGGIDGDTTAARLMDEEYVDATGVQMLDLEVTRIVQAMLDAIRNGNRQPDMREKIQGLVLTQDNLTSRHMDMWGNQIRVKRKDAE